MARIPPVESNAIGDGVTTIFDFNIPYLSVNDVFVSLDGVLVPFVFASGSTHQVELVPAPLPGVKVRIFRSTMAVLPLHLFAAGTPFLPRYVDENNRQLLYAVQETIASTADTAAEALRVAAEALAEADRVAQALEDATFETAAVLRAELASPAGAGIVGYGPTTVGAALDQLGRQVFITNTPATLALANVPTDTFEVVTHYAETPGCGSARYERTTLALAGPVDGWVVVRSADGAYWRVVGTPGLQHFGGIPGADITDALERWGSYMSTHEQAVSWDFVGTVNRSVVVTAGTKYCRSVRGRLRLLPSTANITCPIEFKSFVTSVWEDYEYFGHQVYTSRTVEDGIRFTGCKYAVVGDIYVYGVKRWAVNQSDYTTESRFGGVNSIYCGSCYYQRIPAVYDSNFPYGIGVDQRSLVQFKSPLSTMVRPGDGLFVNNSYYHIREVDHGAANIRVFPALTSVDIAAINSNTLETIWLTTGGGLRHGDGETNAGYVSRASSLVCGHGIQAEDLYPISVGKFGDQLSDVGYRIGRDFRSAYRGGSLADCYVESTRIFVVELADGGKSPFAVMHTGQYSPKRGYQHPWITMNDGTINAVGSKAYVRTSGMIGTGPSYGETQAIITTATCDTAISTVVAGANGTTGVQLVIDPAMLSAHGRYSIQINIMPISGLVPGPIRFTGEDGVLVQSAASYLYTPTKPVIVFAVFHNNNWGIFPI